MNGYMFIEVQVFWRQVKYWSEKGLEGFNVFKYLMIRRPGQAELLSKSLAFGGTSAPKNHSIESRGKQASKYEQLCFSLLGSAMSQYST